MKTSTLFGNNKKFTARLLIGWTWSIISRISEYSKQLPRWKLIANWWGLGPYCIDAMISPKAALKKAQTTVSENIYIYLKIDFFFGVILSLLASTGNRKQCADIIFGTWERLSSSRSMLRLCHLLNIHKQPVAHLQTNKDKGVYHTYKLRGKKKDS